jgi:hypothetical protein
MLAARHPSAPSSLSCAVWTRSGATGSAGPTHASLPGPGQQQAYRRQLIGLTEGHGAGAGVPRHRVPCGRAGLRPFMM